MNFKSIIKSESQLRELYDEPLEASIKKQKPELDEPSIDFIKNSPFLCIGTTHLEHSSDCSPKGDPPGFVKIIDKKTIAIPDRKGNNRLDSLVNILSEPKVALLFMIPGKNETLRLNGKAQLVVDPELLDSMAVNGKPPKVAIVVSIDEVYLHCPKALIRSKLWKNELKTEDLHSYIEAKNSQLGIELTKKEVLEQATNYKEALKDKLY